MCVCVRVGGVGGRGEEVGKGERKGGRGRREESVLPKVSKLEQVPTCAVDPIHTAKAWTIILSHSSLSSVSPHCEDIDHWMDPQSLSTAHQWMNHSQSAVSRTSLSTACRWGPQSLPSFQPSTFCRTRGRQKVLDLL